MQSLVLPPSSFITPEFGHSRLDPGPGRLSFDLTRSTNARRCNPRDLPLPRSMSTTVPVEDPLETSGNVRRPGQSELPQPVTAVESSTISAPTGVSAGITGQARPPRTPTTAIHEPAYYRVISGPGNDVPRHPFPVSDSFPSRLPPSLSAPVTSQPAVPTFSQPTFGTSPPGAAGRSLPQKPTRRTKAHVASACVNCKKKHLGCDPARPCRRCVLSGKEATCVDVTHKKRGRPPLKAEDASLRTYASQADNSGALGEQHATQPRRPMHRATSSRELRPMTDLQVPGGPPGHYGIRVSPGQPTRWPGAMYSQAIDPSLSMQRNIGHRRFSSSSSVQSIATVSPGSFAQIHEVYSPVMGASHMAMGAGRPLSSYGNQATHPSSSPSQYYQPYGVPYSPYAPNARVINRMPMGEQPVPRAPRENLVESSVRLPPIYPPTMGNPQPGPQAHRLSDPYPANWSPRSREELMQQEPRQMPPQGHGTMEPISPSSQMRQAASEFSFGSQIPRHVAPVPPMQEQPPQEHSVRARDDQPAAEAETDYSRPAKRRKMALDDMVND
ncbi:hypothetical protein BDV26DRAFT_280222 [Aspergillus bertholletiae]|uniref:Transcription activator of gluconeogenesis acuK n=1 Tax=Aspergillus bertholletiae TaxID=1226010 RepID=A0A5N7BCX8_9EURO|nr:hypothetical protein BDV26DRAFT_280222 [Aspergillus bertholletiae]